MINKDIDLVHHIDDTRKIVYVHARNFLGRMSADFKVKSALGEKYTVKTASLDLIEYLNGED